MGEVINLSEIMKREKGGARAALIRVLESDYPTDQLEVHDWIIAALWMEGFEIVPIDITVTDDDEAS